MPLPKPQTRECSERLRQLVEGCRAELAETGRSLQEIELLLNQTNTEVERLHQREIQLSNRLREVDANLEAYPRAEIREAYRSAQEVTLRLFMMRSQAEQLQERQESLRRYQERLRELLELAEAQLEHEAERARSGEGRTRALQRPDTAELVSIPLEELILAEEAERGRVSRQLVEGPAQALSNVLLELEICEQLLARRPEQLGEGLSSLRATAARALLDLRRMLYELRPAVLDELGVSATLRRYLTELARLYGIQVELTGPEGDDLPEAARLALYRLLQELAGTAASDERTRRVSVDLRYEPAQVTARVEVQGPGVGQRARLADLPLDKGFQARLERLGASLAVESVGDDVSRATVLIPLV